VGGRGRGAIGWGEVDRDRVAALYVSPSCSRRGVGSALLTFAENSNTEIRLHDCASRVQPERPSTNTFGGVTYDVARRF